jgi:hypothetical protein
LTDTPKQTAHIFKSRDINMSDRAEKNIDWLSIERDYRCAVKSLRAIAAEHGVTEGAIRKRAKRDAWERDLAPKIKAKADDMVRKAVVRNVVRTESAVSERVLVEVNAKVQSDIILAHRTSIERARRLAMTLMEELQIATGDNSLLCELGTLLFSPDQNGMDRLNDLYTKIIAMPARIDAMKKLSDTLKVLIALEREAFSIDRKEADANGGIEAVIRRVHEKCDESQSPMPH